MNKGKSPPLKLPGRENVLDEYFGNGNEWKKYKRFSQSIREYRNAIVHNVQIGRIISQGNVPLVPKKEKIQKYKMFWDVISSAGNIQKLRKDFISMKEQMVLDIGQLEIILNDLWEKPIKDLDRMIFGERNSTILGFYNLDLK